MYPIQLNKPPNGYAILDNEPSLIQPFTWLWRNQKPSIHCATWVTLAKHWKMHLLNLPRLLFFAFCHQRARILYHTVKRLEEFATSNPRIERNVRGGVYRSKFLRDLCLSPDITEFLSDIVDLKLMPHTIPHQLGHLNFNPKDIGKNVDKWHVDTLRFDYVMFVTDPTKNQGGQFQYFKGTKEEMAALKKAGQEVPSERVISPAMPGPGYAVLQQGNLVVHQAKGLTAPGERITMVNGYVPYDPRFPDYSRYDQLCHADPEYVVTTEYSKHVAVQANRFLEQNLVQQNFGENPAEIAQNLEQAAKMLQLAVAQIRAGKGTMEHFGD